MSFIYTIIKATRRYFNIYVALYCITVHCLFLCLTGNINSIYEQSSLMVYANPVSFLSYSIGATFSCIVNSSGNMKCWGSNGEGQLGLGDVLNRGDDPNEMGEDLPFVNLGVGQTIKSVFSGSTHGCAILSTDVAKCWGLNNNGQLGLGDVISRGTKVSDMGDTLQALNLGSLFTPAQIAIGSLHTCVLSLDKTVKCIGDGAFGALGYENTNDVGTTLSHLGDNLQLVPLGSGVKALSIHSFGEAFHNCILTTTQTVKCWGRNNNAQLGYGDILNRGASLNTMGSKLNEVDLGFVSTVKQVTVGAFHTCALRTDDKMKCWGLNSSAQLGIGLIGSLISLVGDLLGATLYDSTGKIAKQISAGRDHTCILLEDATSVKCIGGNSRGQLGLGDILTRGNTLLNTADKLLPINLGTGSLKLDSIIAGAQTTCAVFIDASIKCVGDGSNGALGLGLTADIGSLISQLGSSLPFLSVFVTTKAPTTKVPTTANPTNKPATATPTTSMPITSEPTTHVPTIHSPTTLSPSSKTPTGSTSPTEYPTNMPTESPDSNNVSSSPTTKQKINSPTISPVIACNYQNKKLCKQDSKCLWVRQKKVRLCVTFDCKKLKQGKCNKNKLKCIWDTQAMICNKKL